MQQNIQSLSALERRVDLTVPTAAIELEVKTRLAKLARGMKMPGFRPGKVPIKMVEQTYGAQVQAEVLNDKIGEAFNSAVTAGNLKVAGQPRLEARTVADGEGGPGAINKDLTFSATFEIYPEIRVGELSGAEVQRATCAIGDAEVDRTLHIMRKQRATFEDVSRPAQDEDAVTIDFRGTHAAGENAGQLFEGGSASDFKFTLGEGRMLPEFEAAVRGTTAGQSKSFPLTFPADYGAQALAGKAVSFEVNVKRVQQPVLPPIDAEFARSLGVADGDVTKMRAEIRNNLGREVATRLKARTKDQAMAALLRSSAFEVPKSLVESEKQRLAEAARTDLIARGMAAKDAPLPLDLFAPEAERRVRLGLLLGEVVRANSLQSRPDQIRKLVEEIAQSYEKPQDVINWYLSDRKRLAELETVALEDNVTNWVLQRAKVVDTPIEFDELMGHKGK
ncbi:MAG TPA: trigger factor [Burkholderiaceae bacterium]|jgi:trigger factor|nr:trigger factor [Burkholderiaceae bacterium]